jgi:hypothetical protein
LKRPLSCSLLSHREENNDPDSADQQDVIHVLTGHPSAGLDCAFNNSIVFEHFRILLRAAACCLSKINAERLRNVPPFVVAVRRPYEAALIDVGVTDRNDPITKLIAKSIVNVTASGERDPKEVMDAH